MRNERCLWRKIIDRRVGRAYLTYTGPTQLFDIHCLKLTRAYWVTVKTCDGGKSRAWGKYRANPRLQSIRQLTDDIKCETYEIMKRKVRQWPEWRAVVNLPPDWQQEKWKITTTHNHKISDNTTKMMYWRQDYRNRRKSIQYVSGSASTGCMTGAWIINRTDHWMWGIRRSDQFWN